MPITQAFNNKCCLMSNLSAFILGRAVAELFGK